MSISGSPLLKPNTQPSAVQPKPLVIPSPSKSTTKPISLREILPKYFTKALFDALIKAFNQTYAEGDEKYEPVALWIKFIDDLDSRTLQSVTRYQKFILNERLNAFVRRETDLIKSPKECATQSNEPSIQMLYHIGHIYRITSGLQVAEEIEKTLINEDKYISDALHDVTTHDETYKTKLDETEEFFKHAADELDILAKNAPSDVDGEFKLFTKKNPIKAFNEKLTQERQLLEDMLREVQDEKLPSATKLAQAALLKNTALSKKEELIQELEKLEKYKVTFENLEKNHRSKKHGLQSQIEKNIQEISDNIEDEIETLEHYLKEANHLSSTINTISLLFSDKKLNPNHLTSPKNDKKKSNDQRPDSLEVSQEKIKLLRKHLSEKAKAIRPLYRELNKDPDLIIPDSKKIIKQIGDKITGNSTPTRSFTVIFDKMIEIAESESKQLKENDTTWTTVLTNLRLAKEDCLKSEKLLITSDVKKPNSPFLLSTIDRIAKNISDQVIKINERISYLDTTLHLRLTEIEEKLKKINKQIANIRKEAFEKHLINYNVRIQNDLIKAQEKMELLIAVINQVESVTDTLLDNEHTQLAKKEKEDFLSLQTTAIDELENISTENSHLLIGSRLKEDPSYHENYPWNTKPKRLIKAGVAGSTFGTAFLVTGIVIAAVVSVIVPGVLLAVLGALAFAAGIYALVKAKKYYDEHLNEQVRRLINPASDVLTQQDQQFEALRMPSPAKELFKKERLLFDKAIEHDRKKYIHIPTTEDCYVALPSSPQQKAQTDKCFYQFSLLKSHQKPKPLTEVQVLAELKHGHKK